MNDVRVADDDCDFSLSAHSVGAGGSTSSTILIGVEAGGPVNLDSSHLFRTTHMLLLYFVVLFPTLLPG